MNIEKFFYPKSICVAGASTKEKSIGYELLKTIRIYNYTGKVFPVNPKANEILGYKCFNSIEEIKEEIDLAIVVVPKQFAEETIEQLLKKNVNAIILITAGFKEIGKEGEEIEKRILNKIKNAGARLVGPNCMGVINTIESIKLNATFVAEKPEKGATGFLSQSGALGAAVLNSLRETDIKFAHFISVGNKADINENDILHFWEIDENIRTITFYLESFVDGENFLKAFIKNEINKPTIVLKAGRTKSGMKAASSHTGALSSEDKIVNALLKQFGIIRVDDLNELFNTAKGFENFPLPKGSRIAVVTNAGGPAILAVDALEKEGLTLAELSNETKVKLKEIVHPEGSVENPIDLLPGGNAETYKRVNEIVSLDENVDSIISIFVEPVMVEPFSVIESVYSINSEKPIYQVVMPLPEFWDKYRKESQKKLPLFRNPEDPSKVISNILFYTKTKMKLIKSQDEYLKKLNFQEKKNIYANGYLTQNEIIEIANNYNLPLVFSKIVLPDEIQDIELNKFPLVIKGLNKSIIHKSEIDAIKLNIKTKDELIRASEEIKSNFARTGIVVEEFLIQEFIKPKLELLIGGFYDNSFGPIIMFGSGGKYVEIFDDTSIKSCYLSLEDIDEMIDETKVGKILKGVRGEKQANLNELKKIINNASKLLLENSSFKEFDINPLILSEEGNFYIVDFRIRNEA
ncbi:MAG: acetate--CoA ligase family protein [Melioribacteraceae bacterium]|nr:acetate--CoA ligase family protein [Melioribacteraceae bacterium]